VKGTCRNNIGGRSTRGSVSNTGGGPLPADGGCTCRNNIGGGGERVSQYPQTAVAPDGAISGGGGGRCRPTQ